MYGHWLICMMERPWAPGKYRGKRGDLRVNVCFHDPQLQERVFSRVLNILENLDLIFFDEYFLQNLSFEILIFFFYRYFFHPGPPVVQ